MSHGGARPGAGRPIKGGGETQRKTFSFSLLPELVEALDRSRNVQESRSQALERVLRKLEDNSE